MNNVNDKVNQSGADEKSEFCASMRKIFSIANNMSDDQVADNFPEHRQIWIDRGALQAQTAQAVASAAPKYADFANGDAAMWTENGKLKSEWNEAAPQQAVAASSEAVKQIEYPYTVLTEIAEIVGHDVNKGFRGELIESVRKASTNQPVQAKALTDDGAVRDAQLDGSRPLPFTRDQLGLMVRQAWVKWAETQPSPKPSWLVPYAELSEADKEADRQIGETVARLTLIMDAGNHVVFSKSAAPTAQPQADDAKRLDFMCQNELCMVMSRDGDFCTIWRSNDEHEWVPFWGYPQRWFDSTREAIDAAMI